MKYPIEKDFILEAHNSACIDWKKKIEENVPELFKDTLRGYTGWLYCHKNLVMSCTSKIEAFEGNLYWCEWGDYADGRLSFHNESGDTNHEVGTYNPWFRKATREEIEFHMENLAKEKGFQPDVYVDRKDVDDEFISQGLLRFTKLFDEQDNNYNLELNRYRYFGRFVFQGGKWAKPVDLDYLEKNVK